MSERDSRTMFEIRNRRAVQDVSSFVATSTGLFPLNGRNDEFRKETDEISNKLIRIESRHRLVDSAIYS